MPYLPHNTFQKPLQREVAPSTQTRNLPPAQAVWAQPSQHRADLHAGLAALCVPHAQLSHRTALKT